MAFREGSRVLRHGRCGIVSGKPAGQTSSELETDEIEIIRSIAEITLKGSIVIDEIAFDGDIVWCARWVQWRDCASCVVDLVAQCVFRFRRWAPCLCGGLDSRNLN